MLIRIIKRKLSLTFGTYLQKNIFTCLAVYLFKPVKNVSSRAEVDNCWSVIHFGRLCSTEKHYRSRCRQAVALLEHCLHTEKKKERRRRKTCSVSCSSIESSAVQWRPFAKNRQVQVSLSHVSFRFLSFSFHFTFPLACSKASERLLLLPFASMALRKSVSEK